MWLLTNSATSLNSQQSCEYLAATLQQPCNNLTFEAHMSPPYDSALIQMLSLLCLTFYIKKTMFFWLKGVILTTLRGHPEGSLGPLGAPGAPCAP